VRRRTRLRLGGARAEPIDALLVRRLRHELIDLPAQIGRVPQTACSANRATCESRRLLRHGAVMVHYLVKGTR
jgi:hypothetical protein